ncbi:MAG: hypothetical protein QXF44_01265 [Candidatus Bathyarchaeia archaeon]
MRKAFPLLLVALLLAFVLLQFQVVKPAYAVTDISGDLIIGGDTVYVMEGEYNVNGNIIVEENATLVMRNALVNFTQTANEEFNMTFRNPVNGNPRLVVEGNTTIASNYYMYVFFLENSTAEINGLTTNQKITLVIKDYSSFMVTNSALQYFVFSYGYSTATFADCTIGKWYIYQDSTAKAENSTITFMYASGNANINTWNSTIQSLRFEVYSINCTIDGLKPSFFNYWNFRLACGVSVTADGFASNLILNNTEVNYFSFDFKGSSNVTAYNIQVWAIALYYSSSLLMHSSSVNSLATYNTATVRAYNSTALWAYVHNTSVIFAINSTISYPFVGEQAILYWLYYLHVHVQDLLGASVPSATVNVYIQGTSTPEFSDVTNSTGDAQFILQGKMQNATGEYAFEPYVVEAVYSSYVNTTNVEMNTNKEVTITLDFILPEFPSLLAMPLFFLATSLLFLIIFRKRR